MKRSVFLLLALACMVFPVAAWCITPAISGGGGHSLALKNNGTVAAWGDDSSGQLGIGRQVYSLQPVMIAGLPTITSVSAGLQHALALAGDGSVWAWGDNSYGQLGNGTLISSVTPLKVALPGKAVQVGAGGSVFGSHSVALLADGSVWTWGANAYGQVGDGTMINRSLPVQVQGLPQVVSIAVGAAHTLAFGQDGHVYGWGANTHAQIVPSTFDRFLAPNAIGGLPFLGGIAASGDTSFALTPDGTVYWWGQMALSYPGSQPGPNRVTAPGSLAPTTSIATIGGSATSLYHLYFVNTTSKVAAFFSGAGNLADPLGNILGMPTTSVNIFTLLGTLAPVTAMTAGGDEILTAPGLGHAPMGSFTVALMADGTVQTWGRNNFGQLGDGSGIDRSSPVTVSNISNAVAVAAGQAFALAVTANGQVWGWGDNSSGQLGVASQANQTIPNLVTSLPSIQGVSAGTTHSLAYDGNGSVWVWGDNESGQLGDGTTLARRSTPFQLPLFTGAIAVSAGNEYSLVLTVDGNVWSWGGNASGELGRSATTLGPLGNPMSSSPGLVSGISNVMAIAAGSAYSMAVKKDGTLWVWGVDPYVTIANPSIPRQITGLNNIVAVASGFGHHLALQSNGTVWAWGSNGDGQLGNGLPPDQPTPVAVPNLPSIVAIAAGGDQSLALAADGSLWVWGTYSDPQLAGGDNVAPKILPVMTQPATAAGPLALVAGSYHSMFITSQNLVTTAGLNQWGQIGDGTLVIRRSPVAVVHEGGSGNIPTNDWFLDLSPVAGKIPPSALTPPFLLQTTETGLDQGKTVNAAIDYLPADAGSNGSIFISAMIPAGTLAALSGMSVGGTVSNTYTPVQLTPAGWQVVVDAQIFPFATGLLSPTAAIQNILNGVDTTQIPGAQFCIGYGKDAASMLANGTVRGVLSIGGAPLGATISCIPSSASVIPQNGVWWNPAEGGRGYTIEQANGRIFMATYLYDASGRSTWYGAGPAPMTGSTFSAPLTSFSGGQTLTGQWQQAVQGASPGNISITFTDPTHGSLTWPEGTIPIERYEFTPGGLSSPPTSTQPQTGWWWNPAEGGRGFSVEVQNSSVFIATYMYDSMGNPVWYAAGPAALVNNSYLGNWTAYTGGQTLTGSYQAPSGSANAGYLSVQFSSPTAGVLTLPNGRQIPIQRFTF
jgi:alpha-tubulin suppressor-like RCC1 family protein